MFNFFNSYFYPYIQSNLNPDLISSLVAKSIYGLDQYIRQDICDGCIVNERDYVSTLMSYTRLLLRNSLLARNFIHCQSQILSDDLEKEFGCDAIILFRAGDAAKISMFEAKYPRLQKSSYTWDYEQKNQSHFHDQLTRQSHWSASAAIWELFINDYVPGHSLKGFDKYGSTCVWHQDAYQYSEKNIKPYCNPKNKKPHLWDNNNLKECVEQLPYNPLNLEDILNSILSGKQGKTISVIEDSITIESSKGKTIKIPASVNMIRENKNSFFEETGIKHFLFIEISNIEFKINPDVDIYEIINGNDIEF
ncbi:hypothetical protein Cylst_4535 [Cylindrospermum stagnale PCC 7417]|uniref:Uncharacterized protein n=1 Tax=Cylindrospermum stagnale PCC 7417 TaxID=56107 RepID=K9X2F2_9NOST|nr:hypothetical protein [Cylindrospermum stagnale]AFZ26613.1 hypothetical protein Cylst_4535 [Cylindrospermum stagnale PCC 7417]